MGDQKRCHDQRGLPHFEAFGPLWITSLAFVATNLGAQEVIGMCASGAKYGIMTSHFYWVGAIPAMLFLGVFMMPFYYGSRARSVPEYLKLRFDEKTRGLNAIDVRGDDRVLLRHLDVRPGLLFQLVLGWEFHRVGSVVGGHRAGLHLSRADSPAPSTTRCFSSS